MKKKILFCAALAVALGVGAVTASHISSNDIFGLLAKDNVESMAGCEIYDAGVVVASCNGDKPSCTITHGSRTVTCEGVKGL